MDLQFRQLSLQILPSTLETGNTTISGNYLILQVAVRLKMSTRTTLTSKTQSNPWTSGCFCSILATHISFLMSWWKLKPLRLKRTNCLKTICMPKDWERSDTGGSLLEVSLCHILVPFSLSGDLLGKQWVSMCYIVHWMQFTMLAFTCISLCTDHQSCEK